MTFPDFPTNKWNDEIKIHKTIATALKLTLKVRRYGKSYVYGKLITGQDIFGS